MHRPEQKHHPKSTNQSQGGVSRERITHTHRTSCIAHQKKNGCITQRGPRTSRTTQRITRATQGFGVWSLTLVKQ